MQDRPHWSYSAISQFLACPLRFFFQRVLELPQESVGSSLILGSAVHGALAHYHRGLQKNEPATKDELRQTYLRTWDERESQANVAYKGGEDRDTAIEQGIALVEMYFQEPSPQNIIAIEQRVIAPVHNSQGEYLETPLVAVADLITRQEDGILVNEYKTSGRAYSQMETETSLQPTCYVNAVQEIYAEPASVLYTVLVKTKTPKIQRIAALRTNDDLGRLGDIIQNIEHAVQAGIFYPVENALNCTYCPYRKPCRAWGRPTPHQEMIEIGSVPHKEE